MSNLGDLMNDINGKNYATLQVLGNVLGTVADSSSTVGVVIGLVDLFISQGDDTKAKLDEILKTIQQDFAQLHEELKAENTLARLRDLDSGIIQAEGALAQLKAAVTAQPPVSNEFRLQQIKACLDGLIFMGLDDKWKVIYADQVYYTDPEWGDAKPTPDSEGFVFSHTYILPYYLRVLFIFLAVAAALDPNFAHNYADSLRNAALVLMDKHDKITNEGIADLSPTRPDPSTNKLNAAVEKFSGCSAVVFYEAPWTPWWIRQMRIRKILYAKVGLDLIWDAVNRLRGLAGDPYLPGGSLGDWSLRNVINAANSPQILEGPNFTVRRLMNFLEPPPAGGPGGPFFSLRSVLSEADQTLP